MKKFLAILLALALSASQSAFAADFSHIGAPQVSKREASVLARASKAQGESVSKAAEILESAAGEDWAGAPVLFNLGNLRWREGDFPAAEKAYKRAVEKSPSFFQARKNLGIVQFKLGKFDEGFESLVGALALCGGADAQILSLMASRHAEAGDFGAALACCNSALAYDPGNVGNLRIMLGCLAGLGRWGECAALAESLLRKDASDAAAWRALARSKCELGDDAGAICALESARAAGVGDDSFKRVLAGLYVKNFSPVRAEKIYDSLKDKKAREAGLLNCAKAYYALSEYPEAERLCAKLGSESAADATLLRAACASAGGDFFAAEKYLRQARLANPQDLRLTFELARALADSGAHVEAERLFGECLSDPSLREASMYGRLRIAAAQSDLPEAVRRARSIARAYPSDEISEYLNYLEQICEDVEKPPR